MQVYIRFFLLTIQGIIIFIIGYSFGESLIIEVQLMSLFLYAVQMNFSDFSKYFLSIVYLFIFITLQGSRNIYGEIFPGPDVSLVISSVIILLFVIIIADIHTRLIDRNRHLVESAKQLEDSLLKITRANINYQDYVSIAQTNAASEERLRITRDLHDALGYAFSNILLLGRLNLKMYDKDDNIHLNLEKICQISQSGIQEMRRILRFFRRKDMGQLTGVEAISKLVKDFEYTTGSQIQLEYTNVRWNDGTDLDDVLHRFVQEGLVNAFRHGKSKSISILFWQDQNGLSVTISNDLRQGADFSEGIGIQGMRERINTLKGTLRIKQIKGIFQISAIFPRETEGLL